MAEGNSNITVVTCECTAGYGRRKSIQGFCKELDEDGLYRIGERVFNLQRAILVREGRWGRDYDTLPDHCFTAPLEYDFVNRECLVPGKDGEIISRKGSVVDRAEFERLKDEYYELRGWDVPSGLLTRDKLQELVLADVADDLEKRELVVSENYRKSYVSE